MTVGALSLERSFQQTELARKLPTAQAGGSVGSLSTEGASWAPSQGWSCSRGG